MPLPQMLPIETEKGEAEESVSPIFFFRRTGVTIAQVEIRKQLKSKYFVAAGPVSRIFSGCRR
jgi:hypothetical protein